MVWLLLGILYSSAYAFVGWWLRDQPTILSWFRAVALLVPPMTGAIVIVRRRQSWSGCQWLFWATIALGLAMSALGLTGWAADELLSAKDTWLAWPAVFALFGGVAPLFGLLAQPHRGKREPLAATTAIDIAGLAVVTGFLYSFFVNAPDANAGIAGLTWAPLVLVSELQQALVVLGMCAATVIARDTVWGGTYRRLALGSLVGLVTLTLSNVESGQGLYRSGFVYDFTWILPFAFYPWAATAAPSSDDSEPEAADQEELTRPRPWVIFTAVAMLPFLDFGLRRLVPDEAVKGFRDLSTAVTLISVLPLLVARIAAERAELQQASGTTRLLAQVLEQARDLILVLTPDGRFRHANAAFCKAIGRSVEEVAALGPQELLAHETLSAGDIHSLARQGGTWRGTVTRTRKDGTTFPVTASVVALLDDRGIATHVISVEQDISEERRLREQLIHSERLSAVGQLVAGVAHEINNPLQAIMGYTELLIETERAPGHPRRPGADSDRRRPRRPDRAQPAALCAPRDARAIALGSQRDRPRDARAANLRSSRRRDRRAARLLRRPAAGCRQPGTDSANRPEPDHERAVRHPQYGTAGHPPRAHGPRRRRARSSRWPTTAPACRPTWRAACSSRSSRRRRSVRARDWACRSASALPRPTAAGWRSSRPNAAHVSG